jgi:hypothetical protein
MLLQLRKYTTSAAAWRHAIGIRLARVSAQRIAEISIRAANPSRANLPATRRASRMRAPWAAERAAREVQDGPSTSARQRMRRRTNTERTLAVAV